MKEEESMSRIEEEMWKVFFFQAEDGIRDRLVTGVRRVLFRSSSFCNAGRKALHPFLHPL